MQRNMGPIPDSHSRVLTLDMRPVPPADLKQSPNYYFPMHAVTKESSSTTKLWVVFDAFAKSTSGISLSDTLIVGPTLYPSLTNILIKFRSYEVALSADISKMYRAVELHPADRDLHRFLWQSDTISDVQWGWPGHPILKAHSHLTALQLE